jgi:hypothetical protein
MVGINRGAVYNNPPQIIAIAANLFQQSQSVCQDFVHGLHPLDHAGDISRSPRSLLVAKSHLLRPQSTPMSDRRMRRIIRPCCLVQPVPLSWRPDQPRHAMHSSRLGKDESKVIVTPTIISTQIMRSLCAISAHPFSGNNHNIKLFYTVQNLSLMFVDR